ncbi:MAG TPA: CidA/LrgA family protein [Gemmatimonadaceae bacterium]
MRPARLLAGFAVIAALWGAGELAARTLRLPLPGSVVGMLLLTLLLQARLLPLALVEAAAALLIRWMALFFVPAGAAVVLHGALLRANWLPVVAGATASIVVVFVTVGLLMRRLAPEADA